MKNLLFICKHKSAGISKNAQVKLSEDLIIWADIVFVMENKFKDIIVDLYPIEFISTKIVSLDIPDTYYYMEPQLVELIKSRVNSFL
jgi:predicted protein tyrosine phosphatase